MMRSPYGKVSPVVPGGGVAYGLLLESGQYRLKSSAGNFTVLMSYYRQIRRPIAVFVDTIDEYFEEYVDRGQYAENASYLHRNKDSRIWIVGQLGKHRTKWAEAVG